MRVVRDPTPVFDDVRSGARASRRPPVIPVREFGVWRMARLPVALAFVPVT